MPKRRVPDKQLHGVRVELNTRERDLIEQAIYINGAAKTLQAAGNAISGAGLGLGILAAAIVVVEGADKLFSFFEQDRAGWERENLTLEKYNAYIRIRTDEWIRAAKIAGRYAPAIGDDENPSWWAVLVDRTAMDPLAGVPEQPLTFGEWELENYPDDPPMTFEIWSNAKRAEATRERERKLGYGWLKDITEWVGRQVPDDGDGINPAEYF